MLRTINVNEINEITIIPNLIRKRIQRECQQMRDNYDEIMVEYTNCKNIVVTFKKLKNTYKFIISGNYPFSPPNVFINDVNQHEFFRLSTIRFSTILQYISGLECLCCNSYLCKNNWNPVVTMDRVIKQMEEYKKYKHFIIVKLLLDKIKEKYLNRDIDLDSWLFNVYDPSLCYPKKTIH